MKLNRQCISSLLAGVPVLEQKVPIKFNGTPVGVKKGGVLVVLKKSINVYRSMGVIPELIELNISGLDLGERITVGELKALGHLSTRESNSDVVAICRPIGKESRYSPQRDFRPDPATASDNISDIPAPVG